MHNSSDCDAACSFGDGVRDGVSQSWPVVALDEQHGNGGSGQTGLAGGGRRCTRLCGVTCRTLCAVSRSFSGQV